MDTGGPTSALNMTRRAALGVVSGNPQAEAFWLKNGFYFYGEPRNFVLTVRAKY